MAGKLKMREEASQSDPSLLLNPPSPIPRHVKWKGGRVGRNGKYTSKRSREIAEKIDVLEEETKKGNFFPYGRDDILTAATERPEHPGRVRAARTGVGIIEYFGSRAYQGRLSSGLTKQDVDKIKKEMLHDVEKQVTLKVTQQVTEQVIGQVTEQLKQVFAQQLRDELRKMGLTQQQGTKPHTEAHNTPSPHVSTKGSNAPRDVSGSDDDDDDDLSRLYVDTPFHLVAMGKVHNLGPTIHHQMVDANIVRVEVVKVLDASALVPIPSEEVQFVGQAPCQFIQWPRRLVNPQDDDHDQHIASDENKDPISRLLAMTKHIGLQPIELILKGDIIGRVDISLFLGCEEIMEICLGNQMLSAVILQVWILNHWQLFVLCPKQNTIVFLCSLGNKPKKNIRSLLELEMQAHQMTKNKRNSKAKWIQPMSRMQKGGYECGYYVMRHMATVVSAGIVDSWMKVFPYTCDFIVTVHVISFAS
ncbi:unnamed protein product [Cuscuta europaea]|uniref:DUF8039 domain-containing protein n=1 Tax=Cuscuta europaea TaxID=41803 RepID=A0A9P0YZ06_CUSEU|nr:unnamed protein product [Cuscuta europaea]